jgi:hypothetical protein
MPGNKVRITAETVDKASSPLDKIKDKFEGLQKQGAKGFGIGVGAGATTFALNNIAGAADQAASAVIGFAQDSISKASDLNETMSKAEVIFGDNAKAVEKWAATMAPPAASRRPLRSTPRPGSRACSRRSASASTSPRDVREAHADGRGPRVVLQHRRGHGARRAEVRPERRVGAAAPVQRVPVGHGRHAKLASMGIKKVGGQFTEAQKATARYQLILDQTGDAQGDFARTGDGLANSQRTLTAEIDNLQAEVGQELLPIMKDMTVGEGRGRPGAPRAVQGDRRTAAADRRCPGFSDLERS